MRDLAVQLLVEGDGDLEFVAVLKFNGAGHKPKTDGTDEWSTDQTATDDAPARVCDGEVRIASGKLYAGNSPGAAHGPRSNLDAFD